MTEVKQIFKKTWAFLKSDSWPSLIVNLLIAFFIIKFVFFPGLSFLTGASMPLVIVESCSMYHPQDFQEIFGREGLCAGSETELKIINNQYQLISQTKEFDFSGIGFARISERQLNEIGIDQAKIGDYIIFSSSGKQYKQKIISMKEDTYKTSGEYPCKISELYSNFGITINDTLNWPFKNGINKGDIIFVTSPKNIQTGEVAIFFANTQYPIIHRIIKLGDTITTKGDNNLGLLESEKSIDKSKLMGKAVLRIPYLGWIKLIFVDFMKSEQERGLCK